MADEVTNTVDVTTPVDTNVSTEENSNVNQEPQVDSQENTENNNVENSNESNEQSQEQETTQGVKEPTLEELSARLKEYELRDEEEKLIKERLGISDVDSKSFSYMNLDQQIINEGKQVYLRLCNEYGIDANPDKIDASVEELKKTDPAKAYEFQRRFENLGNEVTGKRKAIQREEAVYEVNKFNLEYNDLLNASPALTNIFAKYIQNSSNYGSMYNQLQNVMSIVLPAYQEAFEAGKRFALEDKTRKDTTPVQGGIGTANTQSYTGNGMEFTREMIGKMSTDDFAKYENQIRQAMMEGKVR